MESVDPKSLLDDINTDVMAPAWVCFDYKPEDIARNAYAGLIVNGERRDADVRGLLAVEPAPEVRPIRCLHRCGRDLRVAVIGLGYVGLPLAISFIEAGLEVIGLARAGSKLPALRQTVT